jgi:hypothetical protein
VECKQALELITASLDDQIEVDERFSLDQHLSLCSKCRCEIELERFTKSVTKLHLPMMKTPPNVTARVSELISREEFSPRQRSISIFQNMFTLPVRKTIFALSAAVAVFAMIFILLPKNGSHLHGNPRDGNIINQSYNNLDGILEGSLTPQIATDDPKALKAFFSEKATFNVSVPSLKNCSLVGAISSHYNDECVAQVIYKHGNDVIYMYETRIDSVMNGLSCSLNLPSEVKDQLRKTGWYIESHVPNCTLMMWQPDSITLCCVVAEMNKERLWACLKEEN